MGTVVGIDPGKSKSGIAIVRNGRLVGCYHTNDFPPLPPEGGEAIIEIPQIYPHSKGDPNDLIQVALASGMWKRECALSSYKVRLVKPREWKGSVPKLIHNKRIMAKLTDAETKLLEKIPKSLRHNVVDAVGLALWGIKR